MWLGEPEGWWGHLPVFSGQWSRLGGYVDWHERQLEDALAIANREYREALREIPQTGFHVVAARIIFEEKGLVANSVSLWEDGLVCKIAMPVAGIVRNDPLAVLGTATNAFPDLFGDIAAELPQRWGMYLKWRRRHKSVALRKTG